MATQAISLEQEQKFEQAAQDFIDGLTKKHPKLQINDALIASVISELKTLGLYRENISTRAFWGAFNNCVMDRRIVLPPQEPVLTPEAIEKLKASFPPVIKRVERELSQKEKAAMAGIAPQSGRLSHTDQTTVKSVDDIYNAGRNAARIRALRQEYRDLKSQAEQLRGDDARNHAQAARVRKAAIEKLNSDPRFAEVRD